MTTDHRKRERIVILVSLAEKRAIVAAAERDDGARSVAEFIRSVVLDKLAYVAER